MPPAWRNAFKGRDVRGAAARREVAAGRAKREAARVNTIVKD